MKVGLYARISTHDQQTLPLQLKAMREYAKKRKWAIVQEVKEVESGAKTRPQREELLKFARRRGIDVVSVWRLDRWGRLRWSGFDGHEGEVISLCPCIAAAAHLISYLYRGAARTQ